MENIIDSNERTLVIFDSVCSGLVECLSLVHSDIKQMTKHRNRLTLIQQQEQQQRIITNHQQQSPPTNYLLGMNCEQNNDNNNCQTEENLCDDAYYATCNAQQSPKPDYDKLEIDVSGPQNRDVVTIKQAIVEHASPLAKSKQNSCSALLLNMAAGKKRSSSASLHSSRHSRQHFDGNNLEGLELLDKQLAESFSQAFNLNDQYKSSILAKENTLHNQHASSHHQPSSNHHHSSKPSIFQVLLGRPWSSSSSAATPTTATENESEGNFLFGSRKRSDSEKVISKSKQSDKNGITTTKTSTPAIPDNKLIIDDINKQIRLAMQYSKQLEAHLLKIEDLRSKYEMHLKMGLVVRGVSRAYSHTVASDNNNINSNGCHPHQLSPSLSCSLINELSPINSMKKHQQQYNHHHRHDPQQQYYLMHQQQQQQQQQRLLDQNQYHPQNHYNQCNDNMMNMNGCQPQNMNNINYQHQYLPHNPHMNDSSSLGTHSSMSSLNLTASWSSSRSKRHGQQMQPQDHYCHQQQHQQQHLMGPDHSMLTYSDMINSLARSQSNNHLHASLSSLKRSYNNNNSNHSGKSRNLIAENSLTFQANSHQHPMTKSSSTTNTHHSKTTIKEFIENIDKLEAEFESHLGSFLFSIEDIQGFARVCQGDTFEISIKYGDSQKFKTRINVLKGNRQKCDNRQAVFKSRIADRLAIKAYECKGLGKRVLLGHKLCETRDLFTARSQLMTISLNQTGSIKLNLIVTWNPLHLAPNNGPSGVDISHISLAETPIYS